MNATVLRLIAGAASFWLAGGNAAAHDQSVSITLAARLPPKCVLNNPNPALDLGELKEKGTASVFFSLSCNANFHFALSSLNGGLSQAGAQARPPFIAQIPYTVSFLLGGKRVLQLDGCQSSNMTRSIPSCSGFAGANIETPDQSGSLEFSWDFSGSVPLPGSFRDTLVLTVGPAF